MGSPKNELNRSNTESPQHVVSLEAFELSTATITQAQWAKVAKWPAVNQALMTDPSKFKGSNKPVQNINWYEAMEFCTRLSAKTGKHYTLPSEAQWEYACRAGTSTPYNFGLTGSDQITRTDANFDSQQPVNVGSFCANNWGLYDMHGSVWEWCLDDWHENYENAPTDGSAWRETINSHKVLRGGSWDFNPGYCRSAYRFDSHPDFQLNGVGFRVCCLPKNLKTQNTNHQLTELALMMVGTIEKSRLFIPEITDTIRKALTNQMKNSNYN
jgi:formylglycine-generating enzyme required for sulfatase activity